MKESVASIQNGFIRYTMRKDGVPRGKAFWLRVAIADGSEATRGIVLHDLMTDFAKRRFTPEGGEFWGWDWHLLITADDLGEDVPEDVREDVRAWFAKRTDVSKFELGPMVDARQEYRLVVEHWRKSEEKRKRTEKNCDKHLDKGRELGAKGNLHDAEKAFRQAIKEDPREPYPRYELAHTLCKQGRLEEGLVEFIRTNELSEAFYIVQVEIYMCTELLSGHIDKRTYAAYRIVFTLVDIMTAENSDEHAARLDDVVRETIVRAPEQALSHYHYARYALELSVDEQQRSLETCLELDPDDTMRIWAVLVLSQLEFQRDPDNARKMLKDIIEYAPGNHHTGVCRALLTEWEPQE